MVSALRASITQVGKLSYSVMKNGRVPVYLWNDGVSIDNGVHKQLLNAANLSVVAPHVAVMPDAHTVQGQGCPVGAVIPCVSAIIPAAVGIDVGCGMTAVRTTLKASDLPTSLKEMRLEMEKVIPHGRTHNGGSGDKGAWNTTPKKHIKVWTAELEPEYKDIINKHPEVARGNSFNHLGTMGTGNHFMEVCLDEEQRVWCLVHSGSRAPGLRISNHFISVAKREMRKHTMNLPDEDYSYIQEGSEFFGDYLQAMEWAVKYAKINRQMMMESMLEVIAASPNVPAFTAEVEAVNCHHNYIAKENHFGQDLYVSRRGALRINPDKLGIIAGSMGTQTFIVRGKGNEEALHSCSHGSGRAVSRNVALKKFTVEDHVKATEGVECKKENDCMDETPLAYKDVKSVMHAQRDLVEIVHTLKQVICIKG